ncbi:hypothetical protein QYE76_054489 [Lolium multiflorum]|uniref:CCHC-type domain-containing protein n=1 Tax=Lolium multiflorum TaxID=4521 RepID=A0AAD8SZ69_LOLMU|nr:hypothetical protein QYE76_054489 [Lolium multiflorum]
MAQQDKSTVTCYECGTVGHYSNECPKKLAKIAANPAAPAQQQRRIATRRKYAPNYPNNRSGRYYNMTTTKAHEAPQNMPTPPLLLPPFIWPWHPLAPPHPSTTPSTGHVDGDAVNSPEDARPKPPWMPLASRVHARGHARDTRRLASSSLPRTPWLRVEHHRRTLNPPDTVPCPRAAYRRRHSRQSPVDAAADLDAMSANQTVPHLASKRPSTASTSPSDRLPRRPDSLAGDAAMMSPCRTPHGHLEPYKYTVSRASISTPTLLLSILSIPSHPLHFELATTAAQLHAGDPQADAEAAVD